MNDKKDMKKLAFWELDRGRCGLKTQAEVEQASGRGKGQDGIYLFKH